ncbi:hypothetical protein LLH03_04160 [bacterium]|nr:hypothetical protein [bacterium]
MTPKDRVACAFEFRPYDRVPIYQAGFSSAVASQILGRPAYVGGGHAQYLESVALWEGEQAHQEYLDRSWQDAVELNRKLELDVVRTVYWRMTQKPTERLDEVTFRFGDETNWRVMRYDPATELYQIVDQTPQRELTLEDLERTVNNLEASVESYQPGPAMYETLTRTIDEFGDQGVPYGGGGVGLVVPRDRVWLEAVALRPDLVRRYLDAQAEKSARNATLAGSLGLRYLYGGGDFASKKGPFISPKSFRELQLPGMQRISQACHAAGALHGFASDGDLWPLADDLFGNSGVNFFYEVDCASGMDFHRLRQTFPQLTLLGGVNSATLHTGSVTEVVAETRRALSAGREYGGCIVGCSNQIVKGTPMGNFWAMMETLHSEG